MTSRQLRDYTTTGMVVVALGVVSWLAFHGHEAATGALISVVSAAVGYLLRGRVSEPGT